MFFLFDIFHCSYNRRQLPSNKKNIPPSGLCRSGSAGGRSDGRTSVGRSACGIVGEHNSVFVSILRPKFEGGMFFLFGIFSRFYNRRQFTSNKKNSPPSSFCRSGSAGGRSDGRTDGRPVGLSENIIQFSFQSFARNLRAGCFSYLTFFP